jgi:hypothetical protein
MAEKSSSLGLVWQACRPVTYGRYTGNWQGSYMGWNALPTESSKWMSRTLPGLGSFYMAGDSIWAALSADYLQQRQEAVYNYCAIRMWKNG